MKKYDGVLKRVHELEEKKGIVYAKTSGKLYKILRLIYTFIFAYTFFINALYIIGMFLQADSGKVAVDAMFNDVVTVGVCTFFALVGLILYYCRVNVVSSALNIVSLVITLFVFAPLMKHDMAPIEGWFGYKESFFWRHFIPVALLVILSFWIAAIAIRARVLFDKTYKKVLNDLFQVYKAQSKDDEISLGSGWNDFLLNYDPDDYKAENLKLKKEQNGNETE